MVSKSWKALGPNERAKWEEKARIDKVRYEKEKAAYKGPWKVPDIKYPDAPKKPMSAFLAFGNERRKAIADANPLLSNAEISSLLSKLWKECPADIKKAYRDKEKREREQFKKYRAEWELMKQREAGVEIPPEASHRPSAVSLEDEHMFDIDVKNLSNSDMMSSVDDWDVWTSSSDLESDSDVSPGPVMVPEAATEKIVPTLFQRKFSAAIHLPKIVVPQIHAFKHYSMKDLAEDDELFEDFSPLDVPTTAPFVDGVTPDFDDWSGSTLSGVVVI